MKGAVDLEFTPAAQEQLRTFGRVARGFLPTVIRDQLAGAPTGLRLKRLRAEKVERFVSELQIDAAIPEGSAIWYEVPLVDGYSAIVRANINEGEVTRAVIAGISAGEIS